MKSRMIKAKYNLMSGFVFLVQAMLQSIEVPLDKLRFVRGTDYQLSK